MKRRHLTKIGKIVFGSLFAFIALSIFLFIKTRPLIVFHEKTIEIGIGEPFENPLDQIKKIRKGNIEDVVVNTSGLDNTQMGKYPIIYTINEKEYTLNIKVVDKIAPEFDVIPGETDAGIPVKPETLVTNIIDQTKTTVTLDGKYNFKEEGTIEVTVALKDECDNITKKTTTVKILPKDEIEPEVSYEETITLQKGSTYNPLEYIEINDNQDPKPIVEITDSDLNTDQMGEYTIEYVGRDRSGNEIEFTQNIEVVERKEIGKQDATDENIIYLTFDDGPSYNTPKILEILDQYQVKATFFVTGANQKDNQYIKQAYDKGHTIGLHTYSHNYETIYQSPKAYFDDLKKVSDMVEALTGETPKYIRFPGGSSNTISANYKEGIMTALSRQVIDRGYQYYDWNISSEDATGNNVDVHKIISSATSARDGNLVILFHDGRLKDTTVDALPKVIEYYQSLGFTFKAIDDTSYVCHHGINN